MAMDPGCPVRGHSERVTSVAISADGKRVVSGSTDQHVKIWDVETGAQASNPMEIAIVKGGVFRKFRWECNRSKTASKLRRVLFRYRISSFEIRALSARIVLGGA